MFAMVDRYVGHEVLANTDILSSDAHLTASGDPLVMPITIALWVLVVVAFILVSRKSGRDPASYDATVEFAMILVIVPLISPTLSWTHYFVFMLLGHAVLWRAAMSPVRSGSGQEVEGGDGAEALLDAGERRTIRVLLAVSFVLGTLASASVVGSTLARRLQLLSIVTVSAMVALAALCYLRWLMGRRVTG